MRSFGAGKPYFGEIGRFNHLPDTFYAGECIRNCGARSAFSTPE